MLCQLLKVPIKSFPLRFQRSFSLMFPKYLDSDHMEAALEDILGIHLSCIHHSRLQ